MPACVVVSDSTPPPTKYFTFNVFDNVNDSRFWKSFQTKSAINKAASGYTNGVDLGIMYVVNTAADRSRFAKTNNGLTDNIVYSKTGKKISTRN